MSVSRIRNYITYSYEVRVTNYTFISDKWTATTVRVETVGLLRMFMYYVYRCLLKFITYGNEQSTTKIDNDFTTEPALMKRKIMIDYCNGKSLYLIKNYIFDHKTALFVIVGHITRRIEIKKFVSNLL